ncbi:uncharacterized protein LY89DRAFT_766236 [Mollisia scopiformis]|uniref:Apple domain-containing protein n=1 Tax=Mollisia scopiformis TaxID=149040 RepID=A0A132B592_MOLSC|nr:uncharacterized protein LY89DRAFT_766236 [Mollisia scopiformis]KUJ07572.1 hypothetical protein LY89DRAFT_766236 [Mollisia scopiformis]
MLFRILASLALIASAQASCSDNNLLRCFEASSAVASPFCTSLYAGETPVSTPVCASPSPVASISHACSCLGYTSTVSLPATSTLQASTLQTSSLQTTSQTSTSQTSTSQTSTTVLLSSCSPTTITVSLAGASVSQCIPSTAPASTITFTASAASSSACMPTSIVGTRVTVTVTSSTAPLSSVPASTCSPFIPTCSSAGNEASGAPSLSVAQPEGFSPNTCALLCQETAGCQSYAIYVYLGYCELFSAPVDEVSDGASNGGFTFWDIACIKPAIVPQVCNITVGIVTPEVAPHNTYPDTSLPECQSYCAGIPPCLSYSMDTSSTCLVWGADISQWAVANGTGYQAWDAACPTSP